MIMANRNSFIHNTGLTEENSLVHLLDAISPQEENEANIIEHSKYYDDIDFNNALQSYNSKISMLSLNSSVFSQKVVTRYFWQMELYSRHGLEVSPASNPNFFSSKFPLLKEPELAIIFLCDIYVIWFSHRS